MMRLTPHAHAIIELALALICPQVGGVERPAKRREQKLELSWPSARNPRAEEQQPGPRHVPRGVSARGGLPIDHHIAAASAPQHVAGVKVAVAQAVTVRKLLQRPQGRVADVAWNESRLEAFRHLRS